MTVIILKVNGDIPYLDYETYVKSMNLSPDEIWEVTGVFCAEDELEINHPCTSDDTVAAAGVRRKSKRDGNGVYTGLHQGEKQIGMRRSRR